jgi:hypothetical protein
VFYGHQFFALGQGQAFREIRIDKLCVGTPPQQFNEQLSLPHYGSFTPQTSAVRAPEVGASAGGAVTAKVYFLKVCAFTHLCSLKVEGDDSFRPSVFETRIIPEFEGLVHKSCEFYSWFLAAKILNNHAIACGDDSKVFGAIKLCGGEWLP